MTPEQHALFANLFIAEDAAEQGAALHAIAAQLAAKELRLDAKQFNITFSPERLSVEVRLVFDNPKNPRGVES